MCDIEYKFIDKYIKNYILYCMNKSETNEKNKECNEVINYENNIKLEDEVMNEIVKFTCPICGTMFSEKIVDYKICPHCEALIQTSMNKCVNCNWDLYEITFKQDNKVFSKFYCEKCKKMSNL